MGGGGGDNYEARQQATEERKQRARDSLNALFGVGSASGGQGMGFDPGPAPAREAFTTTSSEPERWAWTSGAGDAEQAYKLPASTQSKFDEAGFNAASSEHQRRQQLAASSATNGASRQALYQKVREDAFQSGQRGLDEKFADAQRRNKFELFAKGLAGGSEDIDQNALLKRTYNQGLIDLGGRADAAMAQFKGDDENTRLQLLQSIDAGMDEGSALSSATARLGTAAERAAAEAKGTALGDLFEGSGALYTQSQAARGRDVGMNEWWRNYAPSGRSAGAARSGTVTRTEF